MKTKYGQLGTWHPWVAVAMAGIGISGTLLAQGPPGKTAEFKNGKFEATLGGVACSAALGSPGSNLQFFPNNNQMFGAHYSEPNCQIRFALMSVKGPGKYGKTNIFNLSMNWGPTQKAWNFNRQKDDCTFTFTRLDEGGAEGSVACAGTGPLSAATFTAAP